MRRGWLVLLLLLATGAALFMALPEDGEVTAARIVRVTRGDVRQIAALTGVVGCREQYAVCAAAPGQVAQVYVQPGERVTAGQALIRLEMPGAERAAAVWAAQAEPPISGGDMQALLAAAVIRAPENAVVRQVLTAEHASVAAGAPVAVLSSGDQLILCTAAERDARDVRAGMTAEISLDGELLGRAEVTEVGDVTADPSTGRLVCAVTLVPEARIDLPQGARLEADVIIASRQAVPVLPVEAVTERGTLWWVHDGICTEIPAEIVLSDEMQAWVALPEGIAVAVGEFTEGQRVREALP